MKESCRRIALALAAVAFALPGCGLDQHPAYSSNVKYGVRTDPVLMGPEKDLGEERYDPDRPGVLPLMKISDIQKPDHPYHAKRTSLTDKILRDPTLIPEADRKQIDEALETLFGTPAKPTINAKEAGIDPKVVEELKLDDETLKVGVTRYRVHCLHCHGVPGDGRGPTAKWINPHPRDFRPAMFKFTSVDQTETSGRPPSRADLERTLRQGIEGTAMPTFNLLADNEIEALISYVILLSLRGKAELDVIKAFDFNNNALAWDKENGAIKDYMINVPVKKAAAAWRKSNSKDAAIQPVPYPFKDNDRVKLAESVKRGQQIFTANPSPEFLKSHAAKILPTLAKDAENGAQEKRNDEAFEKKKNAALEKKKKEASGKKKLSDEELNAIELDEKELEAAKLTDKELATLKLTDKELADVRAGVSKQAEEKALNYLKSANCVSCHTNYGRQALYRFDQWGTLVRPNNLPLGQIRGGKRPVDIYYRLHSGITGSGMNAFGGSFKDHPDYLWDLVNFVQVLSYPEMRRSVGLKID